MSKPSPNPVFAAHFMMLNYNLIGCTSSLCHESADCPAADALLDRMAEYCASVKGNRPDWRNVTWADLKRVLGGTLRLCLEELEKSA